MINKGIWRHKNSGNYFEVLGMAHASYGAKETVVIFKSVGKAGHLVYSSIENFQTNYYSVEESIKMPKKKQVEVTEWE